jgi:hypothetical protein
MNEHTDKPLQRTLAPTFLKKDMMDFCPSAGGCGGGMFTPPSAVLCSFKKHCWPWHCDEPLAERWGANFERWVQPDIEFVRTGSAQSFAPAGSGQERRVLRELRQ